MSDRQQPTMALAEQTSWMADQDLEGPETF
jgi:hypothetical protein